MIRDSRFKFHRDQYLADMLMMYWTAAVLLMLFNLAAAAANLILLPGNWLMIGGLAVFLISVGGTDGPTWLTLGICIGVAGVGELLEMGAGAAAANRVGASRRALILGFVASLTCSILGSFLVPIPVVGTVIGAVAGAAGGAWIGAWLGEAWKGRDTDQRSAVAKATATGRLWGMLAKVICGIAILVIQLVSLF